MQEVESRKRPHLEDSESLPSKKRAVSVNGSAPLLVNGNVHPTSPVDEEPRDQDSLEVCLRFLPSCFDIFFAYLISF
jgi:hypothetical protein